MAAGRKRSRFSMRRLLDRIGVRHFALFTLFYVAAESRFAYRVRLLDSPARAEGKSLSTLGDSPHGRRLPITAPLERSKSLLSAGG